MKKTFADTSYWVATLDETDQYFSAAMQANTKLGNSELVTTESVLIEVLNYFSGFSAQVKEYVADYIQAILRTSKASFFCTITKISSKHSNFINYVLIKVTV